MRAKQQLLGVVRLISELYKMTVLPEMIMNVCLADLLGDEKSVPSEENIEVHLRLSLLQNNTTCIRDMHSYIYNHAKKPTKNQRWVLFVCSPQRVNAWHSQLPSISPNHTGCTIMQSIMQSLPMHTNTHQAVCEILKLCGKQLDASTKSSAKLESYIKHLEVLSRDRTLQSRIRFLIRDIVELRRSSWVPRREAVQARKIEEIHAEAQAELGLLPGLPMGLPGVLGKSMVAGC